MASSRSKLNKLNYCQPRRGNFLFATASYLGLLTVETNKSSKLNISFCFYIRPIVFSDLMPLLAGQHHLSVPSKTVINHHYDYIHHRFLICYSHSIISLSAVIIWWEATVSCVLKQFPTSSRFYMLSTSFHHISFFITTPTHTVM